MNNAVVPARLASLFCVFFLDRGVIVLKRAVQIKGAACLGMVGDAVSGGRGWSAGRRCVRAGGSASARLRGRHHAGARARGPARPAYLAGGSSSGSSRSPAVWSAPRTLGSNLHSSGEGLIRARSRYDPALSPAVLTVVATRTDRPNLDAPAHSHSHSCTLTHSHSYTRTHKPLSYTHADRFVRV